MKVLFIYRNPNMGFSIGKVFNPIEEEMKKYAEVDSFELPCANYSIKSMFINIRAAISAANKSHYDIIHITGAEHYLLPFLKGQRTVVTVHDLGFYTNHRFGLRSIKKYFFWIRTLPLANFVTFISNKSETEALQLVKIDRKKCSVVNNPVGTEFCYYPKKTNKENFIILHIGTKPNKNLDTTVIALKGFPCVLRIVGVLTENQKTLLQLYGINYENIYNLSDTEILQEYINCDCVNFPSLYEGFGMPIIEGQAVGRPVLTSNISPMKDIAGEGAVLVDPTNPESIKGGYDYIRTHTQEIVKYGLDNVKRFSLHEVTYQYFQIYKQLIQKSKI